MDADDLTQDAAAHVARKPLDLGLVPRDGMWRDIECVERTGSTNTNLVGRASRGAPEGLVLVAEEQTRGRGRMGRDWIAPPRAGLTFSFLVRPAAVPVPRQGWLPLMAGVAVAAALRGV